MRDNVGLLEDMKHLDFERTVGHTCDDIIEILHLKTRLTQAGVEEWSSQAQPAYASPPIPVLHTKLFQFQYLTCA